MTDTVRAIENAEERMEDFKEKQNRYRFQDKPTKGEVIKSVHTITCPACHETLEAVAYDNVVKGWCGNARKQVRVEV